MGTLVWLWFTCTIFHLPETKAVESTVLMPDNLDYEQAAACLEGTFYVAPGINRLKPKWDKKHWCMEQQVPSVQPMFNLMFQQKNLRRCYIL
jgi:hypothetical protein